LGRVGLNFKCQSRCKAEWRLDYVVAENSLGFHAPQEAVRILAEVIDYARMGEVEAMSVRMAKSGVATSAVKQPETPDKPDTTK
jgi:formate-dependent nitrite reductase cytochrome c552 subunit